MGKGKTSDVFGVSGDEGGEETTEETDEQSSEGNTEKSRKAQKDLNTCSDRVEAVSHR